VVSQAPTHKLTTYIYIMLIVVHFLRDALMTVDFVRRWAGLKSQNQYPAHAAVDPQRFDAKCHPAGDLSGGFDPARRNRVSLAAHAGGTGRGHKDGAVNSAQSPSSTSRTISRCRAFHRYRSRKAIRTPTLSSHSRASLMSLKVVVPSGRKSFYIRGTVRAGIKSRDVYASTGIGVQDPNGRRLAEELRFQTEERVRTELIFGAKAVVSWRQAVEDYAENRTKQRNQRDASLANEPDKQIEYVLKWTHWFDQRGKLDTPLHTIDDEDLARYFAVHHESKKNQLSTQKREANVYLAIMNFADEKWKIGEFPKPQLLNNKSRSDPVNKWLFVEEVDLFIRLAPAHLKMYVAGIFATGCRGGPILHLPRHRPVLGKDRGQGLLMERGNEQFCLGISKAGVKEVRILPDWYADMLREYLNLRNDEHTALFLTDEGVPYVRPKRQGGFQTKTAWIRLRNRVASVIDRLARRKEREAHKVQGQQWHDLTAKARELRERADVVRSVTPHWARHTLASHAFMRGLTIEKVKKLGNWKTSEMVARYSHLRPGDGKETANMVVFKRFG
jgi:site-specific recombinase XerD